MFRFSALLLAFLFCFYTLQPALAQPENDPILTTAPEYWLETTYTMTGSAAGNASALLIMGLLGIAPQVLVKDNPPDLLSGNIWLIFLLILPMAAPVIALHVFYPEVSTLETNIWWTLLGSVAGVLLHSLLMLPLILSFEGSTERMLFTYAPIGLATAVLIEGFLSAFFYDQGKQWKVIPQGDGVQIVYQISF